LSPKWGNARVPYGTKMIGLHPRNRHSGRYDFKQLTAVHPELTAFVSLSPRGESTIDFSNPDAVKALNCALLKRFYGVSKWDVPTGYLCPPIPGRVDYLHHLADLLGNSNAGEVPRGEGIRILDVGVGASCIYPLIGYGEYGWSFVGSDMDPVAIQSANQILMWNEKISASIEIRKQASPKNILTGLLVGDELFDATICNPPFHASLAEAQEGSRRKWNNLGNGTGKKQPPKLNFGGKETELCYPGGEAGFVRLLIEESARIGTRVFWFSSLVSKEATLAGIYAAFKKANVFEWKTLEMSQGQKKSRAVAWTFLNEKQREDWRKKRWF
jgi:23S rRNA (adenine1618-N6)-methyltransferase